MKTATHSFLGASSDGKVTGGNYAGLLEIKCPLGFTLLPSLLVLVHNIYAYFVKMVLSR
jgi:hypothetical protein